jgi:hypothetical protein
MYEARVTAAERQNKFCCDCGRANQTERRRQEAKGVTEGLVQKRTNDVP